MRKNRTLVRTTLALAAIAALATVVLTSAGAASARQMDVTVTGAGSTFVAPLVQAWVGPVSSQLSLNLNYTANGSGAGVAAITNRTVDFGASDFPLSTDQFTACNGCLQIPWALAGTSVDYRLDGVSATLKLSGAVLANIYLGKVTFWDDASIKALNKTVSLPHTAISVFHRSDGSGTTYNFTDYLSKVSKQWKNQVGFGAAVNWPTGTGEAHSSGVAAAVANTDGGIGYTDVEYAIQNNLKYAKMENLAGKFLQPTLATIAAAAKIQPKPHADGSLSIVNPPNTAAYQNAYPICTYSYVDVAIQSSNASALRKLIGWAILDTKNKGQTYGPSILFVPIPSGVVSFDMKQIAKIHS